MRFQALSLFAAFLPFVVNAVYIGAQPSSGLPPVTAPVNEPGLEIPPTIPLPLPNLVEGRQLSSGNASDPITGLLDSIIQELGVLKKRQGILTNVDGVLTALETTVGILKRDAGRHGEDN